MVSKKFGIRSTLSREMASYKLISEILHAQNDKNIIGVFFVTFLRLFIALIIAFCCQN
jgi:hypothetical protein